jgi:drug/metabolite transporter (DMT)-like permease
MNRNILKAVTLKLASAILFAIMSALVRYVSDVTPLGQVVFCRSVFAIIPVVAIYAWRRELLTAVRTSRPFGHLGRGLISVGGMFFNFAALARLPIVDVTTITFAGPLITVALAAIFLKERVRIYRWTAVAVGFCGVIVMLWPHLELSRYTGAAGSAAAIGAMFALTGAFTNAASVIQTRRLTDTETTSSIVFYFSLFCTIGGLLTLPFGWIVPNAKQAVALVALGMIGGFSHILLTESYRYAPASLVAPLDYTALLWAFILGYWFFDELPTATVYAGAAIVVASGLFVIWRERQLGLERAKARAAAGPPTGT